eukprot:12592078-Alexandrium_andersonii.AAC.1
MKDDRWSTGRARSRARDEQQGSLGARPADHSRSEGRGRTSSSQACGAGCAQRQDQCSPAVLARHSRRLTWCAPAAAP